MFYGGIKMTKSDANDYFISGVAVGAIIGGFVVAILIIISNYLK